MNACSPKRPGNNGGDGLVAARHLVHFGLAATIVYPKHSTKPHFINLVKQCEDLGIPILDTIPMEVSEERFDGIVDAIFGFSFSGIPREPYATAIANMIELQQQHKSILISVDVPSGWDVNHGGDDSTNEFKLQSLRPDVLISLTVPKLFAKYFHGRHFIGGRFLPPAMAEKYGIRVSGVFDTIPCRESMLFGGFLYCCLLDRKQCSTFAIHSKLFSTLILRVQMPPYPGKSQVMEI